jgi:hypothetical protein
MCYHNGKLMIDIDNTRLYYTTPLDKNFIVTDPTIYQEILNKFREDGMKIISKAKTPEEKSALKSYQKSCHGHKGRNLVY